MLVSSNTMASAQKPCTPIKNPQAVNPDSDDAEIPITTETPSIENDSKNHTEVFTSTNKPNKEPSLQENEIPVHVVMEPVLIPKQRTSTTTAGTPIRQSIRRPSIEILNKAVKQNVKLRNESGHSRKCTSGQYRDRLGRCRNRRAGV